MERHLQPVYFARALSHSVPQAIGRWSYSLYLWHWWPCYFIATSIAGRLGHTLLAQYLSLSVVLLFLIPAGWLSYQWLEAPYFRQSRAKESS